MNDRVLVEALRAHDPGAMPALYDAFAESVYRYCWSLLLSAESAQVALRDTLIAAEAHVGALSDPGRLGAWLYALARVECLRRRSADPPGAAEALAQAPPLDDPADADLRIMAWNAVLGLPLADREVLELTYRHDLPAHELSQVLGLPARQVEQAQDEARERLRDAITAEILARKGPYDCPRRARILSGFSGELTQDMREHLVKHLPGCEVCAPHRAREVSVSKVFELLPKAVLPEALRIRVMSCFVDPELLPYRRYVARRTGVLGAAGFPVPAGKSVRKWPQAVAGALAAVAAVVAIAMIFQQIGKEGGGASAVATAAFPATGEPPGIRLPWQSEPPDVPATADPSLDSRGTRPIGVTDATTLAPPQVVPSPGPGRSTPAGGPTPSQEPPRSSEPSGEPKPADPTPGGEPDPPDPTPTRTRTPCPTPRPTPTSTPTQTPSPTAAPTQTPTPTPPEEPTASPAAR
ncbi:sigma-70 family RNA polymerase sigma factor [Nonomuraea sp. NPDC046802]|uniref:RNA polymerase sigma factor n=1 Tax=Nonomuraea sp. NPDC046802 TaxID=3154919 RepID=UPI0033E9B7E2